MVRILLASPTYDGKAYVLDYWAQRIKSILKKSPFKTDILIVDNSKTNHYSRTLRKYGFRVKKIKRKKEALASLADARKIIFEETIKGKYDLLLSIEQDVIPPNNIIKKLYDLRKTIKKESAIIGVPYIIRQITKKEGKKYRIKDYMTQVARGVFWFKPYKAWVQELIPVSKLKNKKLMKCYAVGYGCTLIDAKIIKNIPVRYVGGVRKPDDSYFFIDCRKKKIPVYSANKLFRRMKHFPGSIYSQNSW